MKLCIYCQQRAADTVDHVPPKAMFPSPRPLNTITVPACETCNTGFKSDDEYFLRLALEWGASETSEGKHIAAKQLRAMKRPEARKFSRRFLETAKRVEVRSPGGLYVGHSLEIRLDGKRVFATVARMVRALYFHVKKTPLPVKAVVAAMQLSQFKEIRKTDPTTQELIDAIPTLPGEAIGKETFEYRYLALAGDPFISIWFMHFYGRHVFVGTTSPEGILPDSEPDSPSNTLG